MEIKLQELENRRHKLSVKFGRFMLIAGVLIVILVMMAIFSKLMFLWVAAGIAFVIAIVYCFGILNPDIKEYKIEAKQILVETVLKEKFTDLTYSANGLPQERFDNAELYNHYTNYTSNDLIRGRYQGRAFICSDVYINEVRSTGKSTVTIDIFKGHFFILDISRQIDSLTQVYPKVFIGNDNHSGGLFDNTPKTEKLKLESVEFNREFAVYCEDGQEAFYLLTPKVMQILLDLKKRLDLSCSFYDNKLYVAVADKNDPFEISLNDSVDQLLISKLSRDCAELCNILNLINQIEWNT